MKSKWWTWLTLMLVFATLVSCGGTNQAPENASPGNNAQATEETAPMPVEETPAGTGAEATPADTGEMATPETEPGAAAGDGEGPVLNADVSGRVEIWHFWASPVRRQALRRVIAICQQELPNIEVVDTVKPFGDIWTANLAAVAAGSGMPDVIISDRPKLPQDGADGVYTNLQEWADRDNVSQEQFYDWAWDQTLYEGATYGIPFETDIRVLFWNKQAFEEAGLDPEQPPETWDDLETYADALDMTEGGLDRIGFFPLINIGPDVWQYTNDADMFAEDGTPQLNNPQMVETMEWIKSWVDRYGGWDAIQAFRGQFGAPPNDAFMSGKVAMITDIYGYNSQLQFYRPNVTLADGTQERMEWGIAPLPYNTDPGNWSGGFAMSIPMGAPNAEAAWEWIKCATGAEGQASWARDTAAQPTNLVAAADPVLLAEPSWAVVEESLGHSTGGVYVTGYPNWGEQLTQRQEAIWTGDMTAQEALDEAQAAVEAEVQ
ncbi:MAG TPA: ABC transporter substrate-binding protein [Anaerolineae bacterium]|nr:ABC transporter substrate-binding protein [Anaerolineae bacterium]